MNLKRDTVLFISYKPLFLKNIYRDKLIRKIKKYIRPNSYKIKQWWNLSKNSNYIGTQKALFSQQDKGLSQLSPFNSILRYAMKQVVLDEMSESISPPPFFPFSI